MINWLDVVRNAVWILGLSIALASCSHAGWWASVQAAPLRTALGRPSFVVRFSVGLGLFCAGLAWGAARWWERGLFILMALAFVWQAAQSAGERAGPR